MTSRAAPSEPGRDAELDLCPDPAERSGAEWTAQLELHRAALTGHCYRMLGSVVDADDAVQDTMLRAWKGKAGFDGRASLRTWLYRIATNVCLDALAVSARRARPIEEGPVGTIDDALDARPREHWLEPIPDARALPSDADPAQQVVLRQSIRLAFVAAMQHLPPKQRAVLLLSEVLGWSAAEVATSLDTSVAAVNSALQRARATLATRELDAGPRGSSRDPRAATSPLASALLERYVAAFERYDVDGLVALLHEDVTMSMPPYTLWLRGREAIRGWLLGRGGCCRGSRFLPTQACGLPAFAQYRPAPEGGYRPWSLLVLEGSGERVQRMTFFLDTETLFPRFGMPDQLPPNQAGSIRVGAPASHSRSCERRESPRGWSTQADQADQR